MTGLLPYLQLLWARTKGPKFLILAATASAGVAGGLGIAAINSAVESWSDGIVPWRELAFFILAQAASLVIGYYSRLRAAHMINQLVFEMRNEAVQRVSGSRLKTVEDLTPGKLLAMLTYDTIAIGNSITKIVAAIQAAFLVIFAMVYLAFLSWIVMVLAICATAVGVVTYRFQEKRMRGLVQRNRQAGADFYDGVRDMVGGSKEIRFSPEGEEAHLRQIERLGFRGRILTARTDVLAFTSVSVAHLALITLLGLVAFLPPTWIAATGATVFQAITVMLYLVNGIENVVNAAGPVTRGRVAHAEFERLWNALDAEERNPVIHPLKPSRSTFLSLSCHNLKYVYDQDGDQFQMGPVDLSFQSPELVFITGGNGSGKTTLLKCLTGLYQAHEGAVVLNDEEITPEKIMDLRSATATVFHDFHLFKRLYGHKMVEKRDRIEGLIEAFGLTGKVSVSGRGFDTVRLSTGQRKRLGLIAALLLDRPILVLDEFGAEQDPEFRETLYRRILPQLRDEGRLILAVTHDDRYFDACDTRIHLDYGRVTKTITAAERGRSSDADKNDTGGRANARGLVRDKT